MMQQPFPKILTRAALYSCFRGGSAGEFLANYEGGHYRRIVEQTTGVEKEPT